MERGHRWGGYGSSGVRLYIQFTAWGPSFGCCLRRLFSVHRWICAGGGFGIKHGKVPEVEETWMGAALRWLIPQKFDPSKREMLGKKEHLTAGQCPPQTGTVMTAASTKITFAQPRTRCRPCSHHPRKRGSKGTGQEKQEGFAQAVRFPQGAETELELSAAAGQENPYLPQIYHLLGEM